MLMLGVVAAGFGAVDLIMIAPKGVAHVAAVGQGDLLVAAILAAFLGVGDTFSSRLAVAEGEQRTARRLPVLAAALLMLLVVCQLIGLLLVVGVEPALALFGQSTELIPRVGDYVSVRVYGIAPLLLYLASSEALKICGHKGLSMVTLVCGFAANAALDWAVLYGPLEGALGSPETAVACATVAAQALMAILGGALYLRQMRTRSDPFVAPSWPEVKGEFVSMGRVAPGIGARHLNDYTGSIVPLLFIGTMGVGVLAAAVVATKVYVLFCRIPQACFSGTFVFYGYALGHGSPDLSSIVRTLQRYALIPTATATVVVVLASPLLVGAFASDGLDLRLAQTLLLAYIVYVPAYFFEQFYGELLTVHQRGGVLFVASTLITYALTIPMAWYAVFVVHSAFLAIACKGFSTAILAFVFWQALRKQAWVPSPVRLV